jgi:tRNA A37 threonylcarbamoyladenosine dehydratase
MSERFSRTELLFGEEAMKVLAGSRVAVFGVGGVGGYAVEALARSGVGALDLIDDDKVCVTNINRQIIALSSTVGMYKVDAAAERVRDINPDCKVTCHRMFYMPETSDKLDFSRYDYVIDAIDTVTGKIEIIMQAQKAGVPVISSMGAGNKLDPTKFEVADIYKTSVCPLAKVMRYQLKRRGVKKLKVVYSREEPLTPQGQAFDDGSGNTDMRTGAAKRSTPASVAFVPSAVGLIIAGEVIKDIVKKSSQGER